MEQSERVAKTYAGRGDRTYVWCQRFPLGDYCAWRR
jgi:hypothetical protein